VQAHAAVVVEEGVEPRASGLAWPIRVGEPRAREHVGLPDLIRKVRFEAVQVVTRRRSLLSPGELVRSERAMHSATPGLALLDEPEVLCDTHETVERARRDLAFERAERGDVHPGERPDAARGARGIGEPGEPTLAVSTDPAAQRLGAGGEGLAIGAGPTARSETRQQRSPATTRRGLGDVGGDGLVAGQGPGVGQRDFRGEAPACAASGRASTT